MLSDGAPSLGSYLGCDGLAQVRWWVDESFIQTKPLIESSFVRIALEKTKTVSCWVCVEMLSLPHSVSVCVCVCVFA